MHSKMTVNILQLYAILQRDLQLDRLSHLVRTIQYTEVT